MDANFPQSVIANRDVPNAKINKKKLEKIERLKKQRESRISKKKIKKQKQRAERKNLKDTRDSLIEKLVLHKLSKEPLQKLNSSTTKSLRLVSRPIATTKARSKCEKLRCVSTKDINSKKPQFVQKNHIETDSSDFDEPPESTSFLPQNFIESSTNPVECQTDAQSTYVPKHRPDFEDRLCSSKNDQLKDKNIKDEFNFLNNKIKGSSVFVQRIPKIELQRQRLPIFSEEQQIVEAINENSVVIISGETGSGKTTQIPQFLFEVGYTSNNHLIGITEPRRIAAISISERVACELNDAKLSSFQIRFEGNMDHNTKLLFMTDGILLRELQSDFSLSKYSVIIVDEAHERSIYTDVLIGLLSRICAARLKRRYPLKLVIMSATLRADDFLQHRLFPNLSTKLINVTSRQYSVTVHFERRTPTHYLLAAFKKICKIHELLPPGGILVFLSGQREVRTLSQWLSQKYPQLSTRKRSTKRMKKKCAKDPEKLLPMSSHDPPGSSNNPLLLLDEFGTEDMGYGSEDDEFSLGQSNNKFPFNIASDPEGFNGPDSEQPPSNKFQPLHCLPLYSLLPPDFQRRVFEPVPGGSRLCVIATNVAETSLTIPNIRYVVDSGKEKRREYDPVTGVFRFVVDWVSQASADQRSGRAGRVQAGHTYRLYSSAVFEGFQKYSQPEILKKPIEQLVLLLKSMHFINLSNFPFPTPPDPIQVSSAEISLLRLGALEHSDKDDEKSPIRITKLGRTISQIPLSPPFAKMLVLSNRDGILPYILTLVSALSVREPLIPIYSIRDQKSNDSQQRMVEMLKQRKLWCAVGQGKFFGDLNVLLSAVCAADHETSENLKSGFLQQLGLRHTSFREIKNIRKQLTELLNSSGSLTQKIDEHFKLATPDQNQLLLMRLIVTHCLPEKIAKRIDFIPGSCEMPKGAYKTQNLSDFVYIEPTSVLFAEQPSFVLFQEIIQQDEKKIMQNLIVVEEKWIPDWVSNLLSTLF